jgi:hypothetical protein
MLNKKTRGDPPMTNCNRSSFEFPAQKRLKIEADFSGGEVTSDGGLLLLRDVDKRIGLLDDVAARLDDPRDPLRIQHSLAALLKQRVYGLALGYEDLNDHHSLRHDIVLQTALDRHEALASSPTMCRMENWDHHRDSAVAIHQAIVDNFIASFETAPKELVLDFDATDDPIHGQQEQGFFHGYYDNYCFLPLFVFCGKQLLVAYLRSSKCDGAKHAWAILSLLVKRFRQSWPDVHIIFRGDGGFCRHKMLAWCERNHVSYIVGLPKNKRLNAMTGEWINDMAADYHMTGDKQRDFMSFKYAAGSWECERRVIARLEYGSQGEDQRYIVTNMVGLARPLYEKLYCQRGNMENCIKSVQLDLFSDRASCHVFIANQFRLLMSALGYILLERLRALALAGTELANSSLGTVRLKLLKIGAVVIKNTRRLRLHLSSTYPLQELFKLVVRRLHFSA